jgi:hypothetical protein
MHGAATERTSIAGEVAILDLNSTAASSSSSNFRFSAASDWYIDVSP